MEPAIIVHGLDDAVAALRAAQALGMRVVLASAPGAGSYGGSAWFRDVVAAAEAAVPGACAGAVLDCDDAAGHVLGAFRAGLKAVRFTGRADVAAKLAAIAEAQGARLVTGDLPAFDPRGARDVERACRDWLRRHAA